MKTLKIISLLVCITVFCVNTEKVSYNGYRLIRIFPATDDHLNLLRKLEEENLDVTHFWILVNLTISKLKQKLISLTFGMKKIIFNDLLMSFFHLPLSITTKQFSSLTRLVFLF